MGLTPEHHAELTRRVQETTRLNEQLAAELNDVERIIKHMRGDIAGGFMPRYHGHLLSATLKVNELGIRILAVGS